MTDSEYRRIARLHKTEAGRRQIAVERKATAVAMLSTLLDDVLGTDVDGKYAHGAFDHLIAQLTEAGAAMHYTEDCSEEECRDAFRARAAKRI